MKISAKKKLEGIHCCACGCKNSPGNKTGGLCPRHYWIKKKQRDPVGNRYENFKSNAKKRNIDFTITIEEFRAFCDRTGYIKVKGRRGMNATVDRRCNAQGYHIWNIALLTNRQNASKGSKSNGDNFDCPF